MMASVGGGKRQPEVIGRATIPSRGSAAASEGSVLAAADTAIMLWRCNCGGLFTDPERVAGRPTPTGMACPVCRSRRRQAVMADVPGWTNGRQFRMRLRALGIKVSQLRVAV